MSSQITQIIHLLQHSILQRKLYHDIHGGGSYIKVKKQKIRIDQCFLWHNDIDKHDLTFLEVLNFHTYIKDYSEIITGRGVEALCGFRIVTPYKCNCG